MSRLTPEFFTPVNAGKNKNSAVIFNNTNMITPEFANAGNIKNSGVIYLNFLEINAGIFFASKEDTETLPAFRFSGVL